MHGEWWKMYKPEDKQITIMEFYTPFGKLNPSNRWVKMADAIPWQRFEKRYAAQFCEDNGAPAIRFRMAMGTLLIKQKTKHSDEETLEDIMENPYLQYLIGLHEFTTEPPFSASSITNFRKYITQEMINEINDELFRPKKKGGGDDDTDDKPGGEKEPANKGTLMLDATCAPAYITYPTDVNLLNQAREKLEGIIDTLHPHTGKEIKPRTYRREARKRYLQFIKNRKPQKKAVHKAIGQQLRYVARDLGHIGKQLQTVSAEALSNAQRDWLETIRELYRQQKQMYDSKTHSVENRIVSISQPHVRPIVRGKTNASVEFGAKVTASLINGYVFIEKLDWEAYNEESTLVPAIEAYKERYGVYPEAVLVDKIFRNRGNRAYCKERGIRISGPRLGRPPKEIDKALKALERQDASARNAIEGKFGEGKTGYGLDRIMARLKETSETVIAMSFLSMNISRRLRNLLRYFFFGSENRFRMPWFLLPGVFV
jgi:hypothetical protein